MQRSGRSLAPYHSDHDDDDDDDDDDNVVGCYGELHEAHDGNDGDGSDPDHRPVQPSRCAKPDEGKEMSDGSNSEVFLLSRI